MQVSETIVKSGKRDQTIIEANIAESIATSIVESCGFEPTMIDKLRKMLFNDLILARELPIKINVLTNLLQRYGYSLKESLDIIENNNNILAKDSKDLLHSLAIANQYEFDKDALLNNTIVNIVSARLLYALIEELKENNEEITEANITKLYHEVIYGEGSKKILEKHPLTDKKVFVLSFMYDKNLKNIESRKALKK